MTAVVILAGVVVFGCFAAAAMFFLAPPTETPEPKAIYHGPIRVRTPDEMLRDRYLSGEIEADEFEDEIGRLLHGAPSRAQEAENRRLLDEALAIRAARRPHELDGETALWADAQFERLSGQKLDDEGGKS